MKYNFDEIIDRKGYGQAKWEPAMLEGHFGSPDLLSYWVADMDFRTVPEVIEAVKKGAEIGIWGYTGFMPKFFDAYLGWQKKRNGWEAKQEWFRYTPGVVNALNQAIQAFSNEGDEIIIQRPVYYPFTNSILAQGRVIVNNALIFKGDHYEVDFENFEKLASSPKCKMFIMSNPHNPVGKVFSKEDLTKMGEICNKYGVFVCADEIHSDLIVPGFKHTVYASLGKEFADNCLVCHAPSKTFNLAGLQVSCIMIPGDEARAKFDAVSKKFSVSSPNFFGAVAAAAAFEYGEDWLKECYAYILENYKYVEEFCASHWDGKVKPVKMEGTYLMWLNFNAIEKDTEKLEQVMLKKAKVALDEGKIFGKEGNGFERINLATPKSFIVELMDRIAKALKEEYGI